jgi:hypothetical protein
MFSRHASKQVDGCKPYLLKKKILEFLPQIIAHVKSKSLNIYSSADFAYFLMELKEKGWAGHRAEVSELGQLIVEHLDLKTEIFADAKGKTQYVRYHNDEVDDMELIDSLLVSGQYFSHNTVLNIILDGKWQDYYVTTEQPANASRQRPVLVQENIDQAFKMAQKASQSVLYWNQQKIHFLRRRPETPLLGVVVILETSICMTNLERTMLDLVVRPDYADGGAEGILQAFIILRDSLDVEKLFEYLVAYRYLYPYHQAIGFYLQAAGYAAHQYERFSQLPMDLDFYLEYGMTEMIYNASWKIYYPKNLIVEGVF